MKYFYELPARKNGSQTPWILTRHLKMKNEEVDRIFRVASELFRTKWEVQRNAGQSLLGLKKARQTALTQEKTYGQKRRFWYTVMLTGMLLTLLVDLFLPLSKSTKGISNTLITLLIMLPSMIIYIRADKLWFKQKDEIARCNGILEKFSASLAALNPLGTGNSYHDLIDEKYVGDRALTLAIQVVDAQTAFDVLRKNPEASRSAVIHGGEWIEKCEGDLETFESTLTEDFGLPPPDKPKLFKAAEAYLAKTKPTAQK